MGATLVKFYRVTDTMYSEQADEEVLNLDVALCSPPLILPGIVTASWFGSFRCRPHCSLTLHPVLANLYTRPSLLASTAHSHSTANLVHTHPSCSAASSLTKICPTWTRRFRCVVPRSASRGPLVKMAPAGLSFNFFGTGLTADASQTGTVHCDNSPQPTLFTYLWVVLLVFEHFAITILLPLGARRTVAPAFFQLPATHINLHFQVAYRSRPCTRHRLTTL